MSALVVKPSVVITPVTFIPVAVVLNFEESLWYAVTEPPSVQTIKL